MLQVLQGIWAASCRALDCRPLTALLLQSRELPARAASSVEEREVSGASLGQNEAFVKPSTPQSALSVRGFPTASCYIHSTYMQNIPLSILPWKRTEEPLTCDTCKSHHLTQPQIAHGYYKKLQHMNMSRAEWEHMQWLQWCMQHKCI